MDGKIELRDIFRLPIVPRMEPGGSLLQSCLAAVLACIPQLGKSNVSFIRPNAGAEDAGHGLDRATGDRHLDPHS